jgi:tripartite-type tricarboxylate transporter receptor subunit TctC
MRRVPVSSAAGIGWRTALVQAVLLAMLAVAFKASAQAQNWPERAVRLVVPFPPGGNVDLAGRIIAQKLQEAFGQPFVIENKPGAGGFIGAESVAKAVPDGYTLLLSANGALLFAPEITKRRSYEWRRDFALISMVSRTPLVLQVHPSLPAKTVQEFFDDVRREPGKLTMATPGPGTSNHLLGEFVQAKYGLNWSTAHYRGNVPANTDLIAGHVQFNIDQVSAALPFLRDGRTRALAVTGASRAPWIPDVPTFAEAGYPEIDTTTFTALVAPAKISPEIVAKLSAALGAILREPDVVEKFYVQGVEAKAMTPDELSQFLDKEDTIWMPVVRNANIKPE